MRIHPQVLCFIVFALLSNDRAYALVDGEGEQIQERRDGRADFALNLPPSPLLEAWGGWSYPFRWLPEDALDGISPKVDKFGYAYLRPNLRLMSSVKVNQVELRMDVYPLSFFGGTFGTVVTHMDLAKLDAFEKWSDYDCSTMACRGWNTVYFGEMKFKWALPSQFFGVFFFRKDWAQSDTAKFDRSFDPSTALPFRSEGDSTAHFWILVGRSVSKRASLAVRYRDVVWDKTDARRRDVSGVYQFKLKGPWSLGFEGRQIFRSQKSDFLSASLRLSYVWRKTPEPENLL